MQEDARDDRPTVKVPKVGGQFKPFAIYYFGLYLIACREFLCWGQEADAMAFTWASAHRFLADRPDLEEAQVVAL